MITPLYDNIIFQFLNDRNSTIGLFKEVTESGFEIVANSDDSAKISRWGKVISVGKDVLDVKQHDYILIEKLMWTEASQYNGSSYWKTNEDKVLAISDEKPKSLFY